MQKKIILLTILCCGILLSSALSVSFAAVKDDIVKKVLIVLAHPDDETMFNLSYFTERGWNMAVVLVTCGENGSVVQGAKSDYNPKIDNDVLIEAEPGDKAWLTYPQTGQKISVIASHPQLAAERRKEFIQSLACYGVTNIFLLSTPADFSYDDNWDDGIKNWDQERLKKQLTAIARQVAPDIIITLNPDETWGHKQHSGLGRIVAELYNGGALRANNSLQQPQFYGIRESGWYVQSKLPQAGDIKFDQALFSSTLGMSYHDYWQNATDRYISQSSHPIWMQARVAAGIVPGYHNEMIIRRLDTQNQIALDKLLQMDAPSVEKINRLFNTPVVQEYR
ncbi:MAG: PIG-L family deacetylase [Bacillota bacterium]